MLSRINRLLKGVFFSKISEYVVPEKINDTWINIAVPFGSRQLIAARLWKNNKETSQCVFLIHPYHKDAKDYFLHSGHPELYHKMGYHVVIFDMNGFGESSDKGFDFDRDIITVVDYFREFLNSEINIGHGISFGAAMLLKSLSYNHHFDKAIIENCLDETPNYFKKRNALLYVLIKIIFSVSSRWRMSNQYFLVIKNVKNMKSLCLIYNKEDELTTPKMGKILVNYSEVPIHYHLLEGNHMQAINSDGKKYRNIIRDYLRL